MLGCPERLTRLPWVLPFYQKDSRFLSVNSAINRSLRKAQAKPAEAPSRARVNPSANGSFKSGERKRRPSTVIYKTPVAVPYTTASSEFLYGTSAVKASLHARRRRFYKLYIQDGDNRLNPHEDMEIRKLAISNAVPAERVKGERVRLMDKMSEGRPHNGYVLEASPLPKLPVSSLRPSKRPGTTLGLEIGYQSREEAIVNQGQDQIVCDAGSSRHPFVVLLDDVQDSGNLGAIIRSAFLLGTDAIALTSHCAPMSGVTLKASAGAAEMVPLLSVANPILFLDNCKARGWRIYAASPPKHKEASARRIIPINELDNPLHHSPCLLIVGSEGEGVKDRILRRSQYNITINGQRSGQGGVDSLNVSVAGALLMQAFLQPSLYNNSKRYDTSHKDSNTKMF